MIGIPYMGSKRKLAKKIVNYILSVNPESKYVYDLFGGGGAISFQFLKYKQIKKIVYNELNTGVCELLKDILKNGVTEKYNQWIDRETFNKHKNDNDWFGGLLKTCWSFGNKQSSYLFGRHIEQIKKEAHEYLFKNGYKLGDKEKRNNLIKQFKNDNNIQDRFELQQLEQLQRLERLQQLERLEIQNKSYEDVIIDTPIDETIIYLDPPYKNTAQYQCKLDYEKLYEWIKNHKYKIYISEYNLDDKFYLCKEWQHRSRLSQITNNLVKEGLYCNKYTEKGKDCLFD